MASDALVFNLGLFCIYQPHMQKQTSMIFARPASFYVCLSSRRRPQKMQVTIMRLTNLSYFDYGKLKDLTLSLCQDENGTGSGISIV